MTHCKCDTGHDSPRADISTLFFSSLVAIVGGEAVVVRAVTEILFISSCMQRRARELLTNYQPIIHSIINLVPLCYGYVGIWTQTRQRLPLSQALNMLTISPGLNMSALLQALNMPTSHTCISPRLKTCLPLSQALTMSDDACGK